MWWADRPENGDDLWGLFKSFSERILAARFPVLGPAANPSPHRWVASVEGGDRGIHLVALAHGYPRDRGEPLIVVYTVRDDYLKMRTRMRPLETLLASERDRVREPAAAGGETVGQIRVDGEVHQDRVVRDGRFVAYEVKGAKAGLTAVIVTRNVEMAVPAIETVGDLQPYIDGTLTVMIDMRDR
jgi:hypothetical protein